MERLSGPCVLAPSAVPVALPGPGSAVRASGTPGTLTLPGLCGRTRRARCSGDQLRVTPVGTETGPWCVCKCVKWSGRLGRDARQSLGPVRGPGAGGGRSGGRAPAGSPWPRGRVLGGVWAPEPCGLGSSQPGRRWPGVCGQLLPSFSSRPAGWAMAPTSQSGRSSGRGRVGRGRLGRTSSPGELDRPPGHGPWRSLVAEGRRARGREKVGSTPASLSRWCDIFSCCAHL